MISIRPYKKQDREVCLSLFDSNAPPFFDPSERGEYKAFLNKVETGNLDYFVFEQEGKAVVCGGYEINAEEAMGDLCWGMVRRNAHGQSLGTLLFLFRMNALAENEEIDGVHLDTSQHTEGFFAKFGFETVMITEDYYGENLHKLDMEVMFTPELRDKLKTDYATLAQKLDVRVIR